MSTAKSTPVAFDSAYAGSMFERPDGCYIRRDDPSSLAAALLEALAERDRKIEDLESALQARDAHDEMMAALREVADCFAVELHAPHLTARVRAALSKATGSAALAKAGSDGAPSVVEAAETPSSPSAKAGGAE